MAHRLTRLLRPRSIAVVGGGAWCEAVVEQNRKLGFKGPVWPVHPTRETVGGEQAYSGLEALPDAPDAVFIGVNRHATVDVVNGMRNMGAGGAVCFASGFREHHDGVALQTQLLHAAGELAILGPNCYGFINYLDRALLWPDQHGGLPVESGVAIVAQSSNIAINLTMQRRGLPIAYMVTAGNQAQTGLAEIGSALLLDERVTALGLHIEGVADLRAFEQLARVAESHGKPVVVLKVGSSDAGRQAALTHTAALSGSDAGASALFRRLVFAQVDTLTQFLETLKLLHVAGPLAGRKVVSMSCSGGEAGLVADTAERYGLQFPPISQDQDQRLSAILGPLVSPANPLDYHTRIWGDRAALAETFATMMETDADLSMLILDHPRADRCDGAGWSPVLQAGLEAHQRGNGQIAIVSTLAENMPEALACRLMRNGIVPLCGLDDACAAIRAAAGCGQRVSNEPVTLAGAPVSPTAMDEAAAKTALARYGIEVPQARVANSVDDAVQSAAAIGFPVALKGLGFAHKSENGAVRLHIGSADAVRQAAQSMGSDSFLVEQMIVDGLAELLIGVHHDEAHGFVLTLAAGGVLTELFADRQSLLVPADRASISTSLDKLRIATVLNGYRGRPAADRDAILDAVLAVQDYVVAHADGLQAVEINPLICGATRAVAADALIVRKADHD